MIDAIIKIDKEIANGTFMATSPENFGGAGLIITDKPRKDTAVVVVTKYAKELSTLLFRLKDSCTIIERYYFYPHLAEVANNYIFDNPNDKKGLLKAVVDEAMRMELETKGFIFADKNKQNIEDDTTGLLDYSCKNNYNEW